MSWIAAHWQGITTAICIRAAIDFGVWLGKRRAREHIELELRYAYWKGKNGEPL